MNFIKKQPLLSAGVLFVLVGTVLLILNYGAEGCFGFGTDCGVVAEQQLPWFTAGVFLLPGGLVMLLFWVIIRLINRIEGR